MKKLHVKATFIEPVLGTWPANPNVAREFIASKSPDAATIEDEVAALGPDAVADKGMTVFPRDPDGNPIFYDYQIKGMFKDACGMLSRIGGKTETGKKKAVNESGKLTAYKKVIDGLIFVQPRMIPIHVNGEITDCQRPLRAQTAQGGEQDSGGHNHDQGDYQRTVAAQLSALFDDVLGDAGLVHQLTQPCTKDGCHDGAAHTDGAGFKHGGQPADLCAVRVFAEHRHTGDDADDDSHQRKRQQSRDLLGHHQCRDDQECHNDQNAL